MTNIFPPSLFTPLTKPRKVVLIWRKTRCYVAGAVFGCLVLFIMYY